MGIFQHDFVMLFNTSGDDSSIYALVADPVLCRLSYVPPYEEFEELKKLQLAVRRKNVFDQGETVLAIDLTEWLGHEKEEYFIASLKYFHDQRYRWKYIFTVNGKFGRKARDLFVAIRCFLRGERIVEDKWSDPKMLASWLEQSWNYERKAAEWFAGILMTEEMKSCRTDAFVRLVSEEIQDISGREDISLPDLGTYIRNPESVLCLLVSEDKKEELYGEDEEEQRNV